MFEEYQTTNTVGIINYFSVFSDVFFLNLT